LDTPDDERIGFSLLNRILPRMTACEKRLVFGMPFQQWGSRDWDDLFNELPSGCEFAA